MKSINYIFFAAIATVATLSSAIASPLPQSDDAPVVDAAPVETAPTPTRDVRYQDCITEADEQHTACSGSPDCDNTYYTQYYSCIDRFPTSSS
ncbi:hypothetical protein BGX26_007292 [Mortierella sp. AD094]|nr:hypothetical protein BGX26_007292 [Mortierella sp. AD094]